MGSTQSREILECLCSIMHSVSFAFVWASSRQHGHPIADKIGDSCWLASEHEEFFGSEVFQLESR